MEFETFIRCPGLDNLSKSKLTLVDLTDFSTELETDSEKFMVRISMFNKCKKMRDDNRCDLTEKYCIFKDLPPIERQDVEDEDFDDQSYFEFQ